MATDEGCSQLVDWARVELEEIEKGSGEYDSSSTTAITKRWVELHSYLILSTVKLISSFDHIAQWLERVLRKHEDVRWNPIRSSFLYGIKIP